MRVPSPGFPRAGRRPKIPAGEAIVRLVLLACASFAVVAIFFIIAFLLRDGYPAFLEGGIGDFLLGPVWNPTSYPAGKYGILPLVAGTLLVTAGAMAVSVPLGIACAICIARLAPPAVKSVVKPAVELLAGIPSVVYGFFGLIVLTDWIRVTFGVPSGESWLAGSLLLGVMALPTIISVSEDAISCVPREYAEGSLALGATHWQTISGVVVPAALPGISAAVILGMGRAIGETMAVLMVTGNAAVIPSPLWNVLSPVRTLTGTLGIEMGEVAVGTTHYHALFGVAVVLLAITLLVNLAANAVIGRIRESYVPGRQSCAATRGRERGPLVPPAVTGRAGKVLAVAALSLVGLPLAGPAGFAGFALLFAFIAVAWQKVPPKAAEKVAFSLLFAATAAVLAALAVILWDILWNGLPALSWEFLTQSPRDLGRGGGIFPAIVGTLYLVAGAIALALPVGFGAAIYLSEYRGEGRVTRIVRTGTDLLNGTPSIVFGLFGFSFLVLFLNFGVSLLAGQVTLALMILPTIIRTTEESLKSVPVSLREGSLALGATQWQTISRVVVPPAVPGMITGAILSIGRAAGETAPILFTAVVFSQRFLPDSPFSPVMALPYHLFILATNVPGAEAQKYGTAVVLLLLVILFYALAIAIRMHYSRKVRW
ncbi:MAG: phosphate ABC transporter permease PstA [Methanolinea sp.]|nr:phosphate ABC transporter permease PstA [Methanolinea sp.]